MTEEEYKKRKKAHFLDQTFLNKLTNMVNKVNKMQEYFREKHILTLQKREAEKRAREEAAALRRQKKKML